MPLILDHAQQPPGGHSFKDASGVLLRDDTLPGLLSKLTRFRQLNGLPAGNPAAEVEADYKVRYPWLVSKVGETPVAKEDPVATWLNRAWRSPVKEREFIESVPLGERLSTCAKCQFYESSWPYTAETRRRMTILGFGRVTDEGVCAVHHWPVGLAALYPKPTTDYRPEGCWVED